MHFDHVQGIARIYSWQSLPTDHYSPRVIEPGCEEIELIVGGHGTFWKEGVGMDVEAGSVLWFYAGDTVEATTHEDPYETIVFTYGVSGMPSERLPIHSKWVEKMACVRFCREAYADFALGTIPTRHFPICTYARIFWEATEYHRSKRTAARPVPIKLATDFVRDHFADGIVVSEIANAAGISVSHLHLLFRTHLHTSPLQLLLKHRLMRSQELLASTKLSVKEICFESGFGDVNNFCSFFKKHTNMTPTQYRKSIAVI